MGCFKRKKSRGRDAAYMPLPSTRDASPNCRCSCHRKRVDSGCEPSPSSYDLKSPALVKTPDKLKRSRSLDRHQAGTMDITYVTERIIVVVFPRTESEASYKNNLKEVTRMLRTKHGTNYMIFNLSEKRYDLSKLNQRVLEFGWPSSLAPPLERLCSICKSIDSWIYSDPQNIAVIHSKGDIGRAGIVIAAYMHYSNICASADQALDRLTMKRFFEDKLAGSMQPSQKRYVHYFAGLLSGAIRMNNNSLYLHRVIIHGVPNFDSRGGCRPFIKIYQGMQQIYTSGVYSASEKSKKIMISLETGLQVRGDVFIKCYHKSNRPLARYTIFQLQFHTCTIGSDHVTFEKSELDSACTDSRFSATGKVELVLSYKREDFRGNGSVQDSIMPVESANDPLVKWDSYENFDLVPEDNLDVLYTEGPLDGSLYATVSKKKYTDVLIHPHQDTFGDVEGPHSIDSGISSSSGIRNVDAESHNPSERSTSRTTPYSNFKDEQDQLDELVNGMLKEIQSIPDAPVYSSLRPFTASLTSQPPKNRNFSSITTTNTQTNDYSMLHNNPSVPTSIISVNGNKQVLTTSPYKPETVTYTMQKREVLIDNEEDMPYHARKSTSPFSYRVQSPVTERRRLLSEGHQPLTMQDRYKDSSSYSWLQRQQEKLKARKEGRGWEDRQQKEQLMLDELRRTQKKTVSNGESLEDINLGFDFSSSSRETSPSKGLSYTLPLHVNTYNGHLSSTQVPPLKPPLYRNTSAPSSPLLPQRSSSKDVTRYRYPQFQTQTKPLSRQNSDTSYDRERPFVTTKKAHQLAKEQIANKQTSPHNVIASSTVYGNVYSPKSEFSDPGLLGLANSGNKLNGVPDAGSGKLDKLEQTLQALSVSSASSTNSPRETQGSPLPFTQSTPNKGHYMADSSWSPSVIGSSPPSSPSRMDRPITPAFPVPPGTPYQNQDPACSTLPPKSPLLSRKDRSPSPATLQNLHDIPGISRANTNGQSSPSVYYGQSRPSSMVSLNEPAEIIHHHPMFVKDTSKYWYKPNISREEAINILKDKVPGTFVVRDSNSFPGAYGLALKVATPPPNVQINKSSDPSSELVRHFLIEPTSKGVRLKGCPNEPIFGSLSALVYQHSITPLALPCRLVLPEHDPLQELDEQVSNNDTLLEQGAACSVLYLNSVDMESLTGPQAVKKAIAETLVLKPLPTVVPVHFKVSNQGITLTDNSRKLFFRRHYPVKSISHCGLDLNDRKWTQTNDDGVPINTCRIFGFVARKPTSQTDNQCHIFAELDPDQPASAIVNFVTKVMMTETQQTSQMV